jgi:hypothetical protein
MSATGYFECEDVEKSPAATHRLLVSVLLTSFVLAFAAALLVLIPNSPGSGTVEDAETANQILVGNQGAPAISRSNIELP